MTHRTVSVIGRVCCILKLQQAFEGFGGDRAGVGTFDRDFARADKLGEAAVHVYHAFVDAGLDDGLDFVRALLAY